VHLERAGIPQYAEAFDDAGYDDFEFMVDLERSVLQTELEEGVEGLPKEAIEKFMAYVDGVKAAKEKAKAAAAAAAKPPPAATPPPPPPPPPKPPKPAEPPPEQKPLGPPLTDDEVREKLKAFKEIPMTQMETLFNALHLDEDQAEKWVEEGYDDPKFLKDLSPEDLDEIAQTTNMKRGHLLRVQCWLKGLVVCTGEDEFVVVHRYAGHFLKSVGEKTAAAQAAPEKKG